MSRYQGGKSRNGRKIVESMDKIIKKLQAQGHIPTQFTYLEPFMGMAGVLRHAVVKWPSSKFLVSDRNVGVVRMWQKLVKTGSTAFIPNTVTSTQFNLMKSLAFKDDSKAPIRGIVGHAMSFGGAYFSGFVGKYEANSKRNYMATAKKTLGQIMIMLKATSHLKIADPQCYSKFKVGKTHVVYCDPPYLRGKECSRNHLYQKFDHDAFWSKMNKWSKTCIVFVSEESAPKDWVNIHSAIIRRSHNHYSKIRNDNPNADNVRTKYFSDSVFIHKRWKELL